MSEPEERRAYRVRIISPGEAAFERFVNLMNALARRVPRTNLEFASAGEREAIALVAGEAEMVVPYPPGGAGVAGCFLSAAPVTKAFYVLYTNVAKPLDASRLAAYALEGERRNENVLGVTLAQSGGPGDSLRKVHEGTLDGYINAEGATDPTLRRLGYANIHRELFRAADNYVLLPSSEAGRSADRFLSAAVPLAPGEPGYDTMQRRPYGEWQPV